MKGIAMKKMNSKKQSLYTLFLRIFLLIVFALFSILLFLVWGMLENRNLAHKYIQDTAKLYVEQVNKNITQINRELIVLVNKNKDIASLPSEMKVWEGKYYSTLRSLREQNNILKIRYDEVDYFYVYALEADVFISGEGTTFSQSIKSELNNALIQKLKEEKKDNSMNPEWFLLHTKQKDYIISSFFQKGKAMGCVMQVDDIFQNLEEATESYQVIPFIEKKDGDIIMSTRAKKQYGENFFQNPTYNGRDYTYRLNGLGQIHLYVLQDGGVLEDLLNMQILLILLVLVLLFICTFSLYFYYRKIMSPVRRMLEGINEINEEWIKTEGTGNSLLELEIVNDKFKELLQKIQSLKIAIYEEKLVKQQTELEYAQQQIKPHFFLNCLSLIHGIADTAGEKQILYITEVLSDYMRYIFKDSGGKRRLLEELQHVRLYVEIQKLRYGAESFTYEEILDENINDCMIPSLLLQTLIENSIVHGINSKTPIEISLYVTFETYENSQYLYICVSDTGTGFSEEILKALQEDTPILYHNRKHIGLQNLQRRLSLIYGKQAGITFSNMAQGYGAVIEIRIPL